MKVTCRSGRLAAILWCVPAAAALLAAPAIAADITSVEALQEKLVTVGEEVRPSIVAIRAERAQEPGDLDEDEAPAASKEPTGDRLVASIGSGVLISADGLILTNEHVIRSAEPGNIECTLHDGQTYTVQGMTSDPRSDLAVLRIDGRNFKPARLGDLGSVKQGQFVIVIGNPFGEASENYGRSAMSFGIVSALGQDLTQKLDMTQQRYYGNLIQTDARINPGNSGGPLVNIYGEVIGIATAISTRSGTSEGVGYAIPMDRRTKEIVNRLMHGEQIQYGFIGVRLEPPTATDRKTAGGPPTGGALIKEVDPNTPASKGNLLVGDIVADFGGQRINDVEHLIELVGGAQINKEVPLTVYRNGQRVRTAVVPARKQIPTGVHVEAPLSWRGMRLADPSPEVRESFKLSEDVVGVVVTQVDSNGPAHKAGLKPGTVITRVNNEPIHGLRRLRELTPKWNGSVRITSEGAEGELTLPSR
jgi:serine protease Do